MLWVRDYNKNMNVDYRNDILSRFLENIKLITDKLVTHSFRF